MQAAVGFSLALHACSNQSQAGRVALSLGKLLEGNNGEFVARVQGDEADFATFCR